MLMIYMFKINKDREKNKTEYKQKLMILTIYLTDNTHAHKELICELNEYSTLVHPQWDLF